MTITHITPEERAELEYLCAWIATDKNDLLKNPHTILKAALNDAPMAPDDENKAARQRMSEIAAAAYKHFPKCKVV